VVHASTPLSPGVSPAESAPGASPSQATIAAAAAVPATAAVGTGANDPSHAQRVTLYVLSQLESLAVHTVCRRPPLHPPAPAMPDSTSAHHLLRRASSAVPNHGSTSSSNNNASAGGTAAAGGNGSSSGSGSGSGMSGAISSGSLFTLEEGVVGTEAGTQYPKVQRHHCEHLHRLTLTLTADVNVVIVVLRLAVSRHNDHIHCIAIELKCARHKSLITRCTVMQMTYSISHYQSLHPRVCLTSFSCSYMSLCANSSTLHVLHHACDTTMRHFCLACSC
jgi:hypothetical protein